jgi:hypothetical protein
MQWVALYSDGSGLCQYNGDGSENKYADIDRARLTNFALFTDDHRKVVEIHLEPGQRLIYRRRVEHPPGKPKIVVYMVGWQQTIAGQNVQSIAYVFPDGRIEIAGQFREDHRWFYAIEPVPCEI